ncbi:hypothetical protein ES707_09530 [subsurface metagenome]
MAVNCRTCMHYQDSIALKYEKQPQDCDSPCTWCADYSGRKSNYEPIKHISREKQAKMDLDEYLG